MWFRNLQIYPLKAAALNPASLGEMLARHPLIGCGALERRRTGWVQVHDDAYLYRHEDQMLIAMGIEEKVLPSAVVKQATEAKIAEITLAEGYRPGGKRRREIREMVEDELLPRAFCKRNRILAWIDTRDGWLVVDSSSEAKAYDLVKLLHGSCPDLAVRIIGTEHIPTHAMTNWLMQDAPDGFTIDRDGELRLPGEDRATVRYVHHALDGQEIAEHIAAGKQATRLGLTWSGRVSFVLNDKLEIKRLQFLDILKEQSEQAEDAEAMFRAEFAIMTGELRKMIADLVAALGGLRKDLAD